MFVVGTYGLSAVVGAAAAIVLGDTGSEPHPVVFMGGFYSPW